MIAVHCLSNALSKAILANFFSVGPHVSSRLYCAIDSIDDSPFCFRVACRGQPNNNLLKLRLQRRQSDSLCFWDGTSSHLSGYPTNRDLAWDLLQNLD